MRIVTFTDSHISHKNPSSRIDDYCESIIKKLTEVIALSNKCKANVILCAGDLFNAPTPTPNSVMIANNISRIFLKSKAPIYVVPGNHDEFGYNADTLNKTLLGMYAASGVVRILDRKNPLTIKQNNKIIAIEGQEYYAGIDDANEDNFLCNVKADYNILVSHCMVTNAKITTHYKKNNVAHIDINDVRTNANLVITGHEHNGYGVKEVGSTTFINPGSLGRTDTSLSHMPGVYIIDIDNELVPNFKEYKLQTAKKYDEIFNKEAKQEAKEQKILLDTFKSGLKNLNVENSSKDNIRDTIENVIKEYEKENKEPLDKEIIDLIYKYIQSSDENVSLSRHLPKNYKLTIEEVKIKNFQSHKDTVVKFRDGLNAIVGESDCGKTVIVRAIIWCLYNSPKGTEFIRTGAKETSVRVTFNDGTYIERTRTLKNSGKYAVCDINGEIKEFEGFGNDIPLEVMNEHQMPYINISKDVTANINISEQLEAPFLLCESPSVKANAVGKITKTDTVDMAIKEISAESKSIQKEIRLLDKQLVEKNKELEQYSNLDKDKEVIDKLGTLFDKYDFIYNEVSKLQSYINRLSQIDQNINELNNYFNNCIDFSKAESLLQESKNKVVELDRLIYLCGKVNSCNDKINELKVKIDNSINVDGVEEKISKVSSILNDLMYVDGFINKNARITSSMKRCKEDYSKNSEIIKNIENKINNASLELDSMLSQLNVCETCNSVLTDENKEYIKNI